MPAPQQWPTKGQTQVATSGIKGANPGHALLVGSFALQPLRDAICEVAMECGGFALIRCVPGRHGTEDGGSMTEGEDRRKDGGGAWTLAQGDTSADADAAGHPAGEPRHGSDFLRWIWVNRPRGLAAKLSGSHAVDGAVSGWVICWGEHPVSRRDVVLGCQKLKSLLTCEVLIKIESWLTRWGSRAKH